jgi:hypothetical protein
MPDYLTGTRVPDREKTGEMSGENSGAEAGAHFYVYVSRSPPLALEVTGDLDKEKSRDGRSGNDLGIGLTRFDCGIDERQCEEVFFATPSPPISGNTEVTRELD